MDLIDHEVASERRYRDLKSNITEIKSDLSKGENTMSTQPANFFETSGNGGNTLAAGALGYVLGNGGLGGLGGGGANGAITLNQIDDRFNGLQTQMSTNSLREQGADTAIALGAGIAGVKDAVNHASSHNQLALCGLGHSVQAGFANLNQTILLQGAAGRELTLSENLAQTRAALAAAHNDAGHRATQVLLNQINLGKA